MTPYAVQSGDIPPSLLRRFREMRSKLEELPDFEEELLTCHSVSFAFAKHYGHGLQCVDGAFGGLHDHSWIVDVGSPGVILDMYPVAGASSFIVVTSYSLLPWFKLYVPGNPKFDKKIRKRQVAKILAFLNGS